jgi:hypothetical protein
LNFLQILFDSSLRASPALLIDRQPDVFAIDLCRNAIDRGC